MQERASQQRQQQDGTAQAELLHSGPYALGVRQGAQCADDAEQLSGACPEHLLAASAAGKQLAGDLNGGASTVTSLPGATETASQCTDPEQDYATARVIVNRRTISRKAAHWASMEHVPSEPGAHKPPERWAELSPRTVLKPAHHSQQQAQRTGPPPPRSSSSGMCAVLHSCGQAAVRGWEWLRHMCRELVKVCVPARPLAASAADLGVAHDSSRATSPCCLRPWPGKPAATMSALLYAEWLG